MASRAPRSAGLVRSLTLLWVFAATSGVILAVAAFGLSSVLADRFRSQVLDDTAREAALLTRSVLVPRVVRGRRLVVRPRTLRRVATRVGRTNDVLGVSVWRRDGTLAA